MGKTQNIHWLVPASILSCLAFGVLCALGHHLFYQSLQGSAAQDDNIPLLGTHISQQQLNTAGGTAFAFLVNSALTGAVSMAYIQLFWHAAIQASQPISLDTLDTMFAALSNVFSLCAFRVWWRYPLMFVVAMTAWYVNLQFPLAFLTSFQAITDCIHRSSRYPVGRQCAICFAYLSTCQSPRRRLYESQLRCRYDAGQFPAR